MVLAVIGAVIVWFTDSNVDDPGIVRASGVESLCDELDVGSFDEWELAETAREPAMSESAGIPRGTCEITLVAGEDTTDYVAVTLRTDARVQETVKDAVDAYEGVVDYERSNGRTLSGLETGDESGLVTVIEESEQQQYHVHIRDSNALLSVSMVITGTVIPPEQARDALITFAAAAVDVMRSE